MLDSAATVQAGWRLDNSYARLPDIFYTRMEPVKVAAPKLVVLNESLARSLGLDAEALRGQAGADVFAGNRIPEGAAPLAQAYAGHQFGYFTMLGDGRAILLGEQMTPAGERFDVQLKGAGLTPYSRGGDGRAALGPMLREYIISEGMQGLGIPTTRSLAVATTGQPVIREESLQGAILTRIAASHLRVGTFQYAAQWASEEELRILADYTIRRHFPEVDPGDEQRYLLLLREVISRQAKLIAGWQLVGFVHGVMNTDNMALSGETIDYGPCAFLDAYDPSTVFSSIDREGRYAYGNQPRMAVWNLTRFAETLLPLLHEREEESIKLAEDALGEFGGLFEQSWLAGMRAKLGWFGEEAEDRTRVESLLALMQKHRADYTNTFRAFTLNSFEDTGLTGSAEFLEWQNAWRERQSRQQPSPAASEQLMRSANPAIIPRNHRVEEALEAAVERGDYGVMERLVRELQRPYDYTPEQVEYSELPAPTGRRYRTYCGT